LPDSFAPRPFINYPILCRIVGGNSTGASFVCGKYPSSRASGRVMADAGYESRKLARESALPLIMI
jgi:hypothetical protein